MVNLSHDPLKIVVLECPYDTWDDPYTQTYFGKMVSMKMAGYRMKHPYGVLPVDTTDFISTHVLICSGSGQNETVLTGYKFISWERCLIHRVPFPMVSIFNAAQAHTHKSITQALIQNCENNGTPLIYTGSWTFHPSVFASRELKRELHSLFVAAYYFAFRDLGSAEIICGCVPSVRTDILFQKWGHERVLHEGKPLKPVSVPHLQGDEVVLMHLNQFSVEVIQNAVRWEALWKQRQIISANDKVIPFKKAS